MFDIGSESYRSDVKLGTRYRELNTGLEGTATAVYFFQHACERVQLDYVHDGELKQVVFDAAQLAEAETVAAQHRAERARVRAAGREAREARVRAAQREAIAEREAIAARLPDTAR